VSWRLPVRPRLILRGLFLIVFILVVLYFLFLWPNRPEDLSDVRGTLNKYGVWAPVAAIVLHAISVVLLIPGFLVILATALIFGLDSIWISIIGQTLGNVAAYFVARLAGRDILHAILGQRVRAIERILKERGFQYLLYLRLMALIPLPLLAYGPGLVKVPFRQYLFATVLGSAPFILVIALFGDSIKNIREPSDLVTPFFIFPFLLLVALVSFPLMINILARRFRRRRIPGIPLPGGLSRPREDDDAPGASDDADHNDDADPPDASGPP